MKLAPAWLMTALAAAVVAFAGTARERGPSHKGDRSDDRWNHSP
jgi:hypothetical protein